ncbi:MAG: HD domain-containing protein, partial [Candidatus Gracilibacteria bacterium]|nr:HD domain-containing protein [Candidatus Gracilibacteria bacterium]
MGITDLINAAKQYSKVNEKKLREAYAFAEMAHSGQTRMSGEPYITHPLAVAMLLASYKADEDSLVVALLHDVIEDTPHELKEIEAQFGKSVARMVDAMTKLPSANLIQPPQASHFDSRIESIRKIFEVMQEDVRVIVIKLCDRLHNMETLSHFRSEKQKRIAQETLDIYVKIAERLGIGDLREKLENLSNQYLFPEEYKNIQAATQREHQKFGALSKKIMTLLRSDHFLSSAQKIHIRHMFSYEKVFSEGIQETPPDAVVSLLFAREEDCYLALRSVHSLWKVVRGGVQDYIALPRSNGYQALETSTIKNEGGVIKFVLQTQRMYDYSQFGIMLQCFSDEKSDKIVVLPWVQHLKKVHHGTRQSSNDYMLAL